MLVVLAQWTNVGCVCFILVERVKIVFNIATQIAVYLLKYRIQSEMKGRKGHYTLVAKGLSLFSFYSMPTNHFLKAKYGNSPLCFFWGLFYFISTTWGKERSLYRWSTAIVRVFGAHGLPSSNDTLLIVETIEFHFFFILTWNIESMAMSPWTH